MEYYSLLNLDKEPFSNSPDPDFFFESSEHTLCLQRLEIALRLRRGLNVVLGAVGTGKTTLCRQLLRRFADDPQGIALWLPDPHFDTPAEALAGILESIHGKVWQGSQGPREMKEAIRGYLFDQGVAQQKLVVLIIDEGQKIAPFFLEILRELLNYETNCRKLLQIVIFAQPEFSRTLDGYPNFADRINLRHTLGPLARRESCRLIRYRLSQAGGAKPFVFTYPALWAIHGFSGGYPRRIIHLCHHCLLGMIVQNRSRVNRRMVRACVRRGGRFQRSGVYRTGPWAVILMLVLGLGLLPQWIGALNGWPVFSESGPESAPSGSPSPGSGGGDISGPGTDGDRPSLGTLRVQAGQTLGGLSRYIYGNPAPDRLAAIVRYNPGLDDPHQLSVGQPIRFPALPLDLSPYRYGVELATAPDLEAAVAQARQYESQGLPVRLLYERNGAQSPFSLLLKPFYRYRSEAARTLARLEGRGRIRALAAYGGDQTAIADTVPEKGGP